MSDQSRDDETGQFGQMYSDNSFLSILWEHGESQTSTVAHTLNCGEKTAYNRLTTLEEKGRVTKRSVGQAYLWSLSDDEKAENK